MIDSLPYRAKIASFDWRRKICRKCKAGDYNVRRGKGESLSCWFLLIYIGIGIIALILDAKLNSDWNPLTKLSD